MNPKILITSATGKTGFATTKQLLSEGYSVRIFVRSRNEKALELEKLGAEIAIGNYDNKLHLKQALLGIDNVYYCYPLKSGLVNDTKLFIAAAKEANINSVVFMGQRIAEFEDTGSAFTNELREAYELLKSSGLKVIYFIPGYFADNAFVVAEFVLQLSLMPNPFGSGKNPWISTNDMARCIVALLKNPEPYIDKKLFPTGNKSISANEMVAIYSKVRGKKVIKVNIPNWLFLKAGIMTGKEFGFDEYGIVQASFYNKQMQMNRFDIEPTTVVKDLTGNEPEDFETITRQYFNNSPYKTRSFSSWLKTFVKFNKMPFTKIPDKKRVTEINK
jgi:NAD(P)H dehydrogenase (quinone)